MLLIRLVAQDKSLDALFSKQPEIMTSIWEPYILSVNEKLPVWKFPYFGKYIIQHFGYCYVHVSSHRQAGLER